MVVNDVVSLEKNLEAVYNRFTGVYDQFLFQKESMEKEILVLKRDYRVLDSLIRIMDQYVDISNDETLSEVKTLINEGLLVAFPNSRFSVDITYKISRGNQTIDFKVLKNGFEEPLLDAQSGGILDIVSFLLRVFVICKLNLQRFIFLDEALNGVSDLGDYSKNASYLVKQICEKKGFTILLVTHKDALGKQAHISYLGRKDTSNNVESLILERA